MATFDTEHDAARADLHITHEPQFNRYAVHLHRDDAEPRLVGEAHYALIDQPAGSPSIIDFDHTFVEPEFRATGLSRLLARRALTGSAVRDKRVHASCWFIRGYLARHPELVPSTGESQQ